MPDLNNSNSYAELVKIAIENGGNLVCEYGFRCTKPTDECARDLVQYAIEVGYKKDKSSVRGETFMEWCKRGKPAPEWAVSAACDLVLMLGYEPEAYEDWVTVVFTHCNAHGPFYSIDAAIESFPQGVVTDTLSELVNIYLNSQPSILIGSDT